MGRRPDRGISSSLTYIQKFWEVYTPNPAPITCLFFLYTVLPWQQVSRSGNGKYLLSKTHCGQTQLPSLMLTKLRKCYWHLNAFIILHQYFWYLSLRVSREQVLLVRRHSSLEASLSPCWVLTFIFPLSEYNALFWISNNPTLFQQEDLCLLYYMYLCQEIQPEIHKDTIEK